MRALGMQTTGYNIGIAAGCLAGGLILDGTGAGALLWAAALPTTAALAIAAAAPAPAFLAPSGPCGPGGTDRGQNGAWRITQPLAKRSEPAVKVGGHASGQGRRPCRRLNRPYGWPRAGPR